MGLGTVMKKILHNEMNDVTLCKIYAINQEIKIYVRQYANPPVTVYISYMLCYRRIGAELS